VSEGKILDLSVYRARREATTGTPIQPQLPQLPPPMPPPTLTPQERRRQPRVKYHYKQRPMVSINNVTYAIVNMSQTGVKYIGNAENIPELGERLTGSLHLGAAARLGFEALVVRTIGDLIILEFTQPVPSELLIAALIN